MTVKLVQPQPLQPKIATPKSMPAPHKSIPANASVSVSTPVKEKPAAQKTTVISEKKPESLKKTVVKSNGPTKKTAPVKPTPQTKSQKNSGTSKISRGLAKELEESIAKIDEKRDNFSSKARSANANKAPPAPMTRLSSLDSMPLVATASSDEIRELLVQELREVLHLPDFGEVKVRLSFRVDGSIAEVKVLKADSKKNKEYLERELPRHGFPFIADLRLTEKERSFVISFCNEI